MSDFDSHLQALDLTVTRLFQTHEALSDGALRFARASSPIGMYTLGLAGRAGGLYFAFRPDGLVGWGYGPSIVCVEDSPEWTIFDPEVDAEEFVSDRIYDLVEMLGLNRPAP
jgi:hypothetical protein